MCKEMNFMELAELATSVSTPEMGSRFRIRCEEEVFPMCQDKRFYLLTSIPSRIEGEYKVKCVGFDTVFEWLEQRQQNGECIYVEVGHVATSALVDELCESNIKATVPDGSPIPCSVGDEALIIDYDWFSHILQSGLDLLRALRRTRAYIWTRTA